MEDIFFTYANASTPKGAERIENIFKLFRTFFVYETLDELNLTLNFAREEIKTKPKARFIVLAISQAKEFGLGIYSSKEIREGKVFSKKHNMVHQYLEIDTFTLKLIDYLRSRKKKD